MLSLILSCVLSQQPAVSGGYTDAEMTFRVDSTGQKWGYHPGHGWARVIHDQSLPKGVTVAPGARYVSGPGDDIGATKPKAEATRTPSGGHGSGTGGGRGDAKTATVVAKPVEVKKTSGTTTAKAPNNANGLARYNETNGRLDRFEGDIAEIRTTLKRLIELMEQK